MQNYSAIKKNKQQENPTICDNMDRPWRRYAEDIMLSVRNKSERQILYDLIYIWNLKVKTQKNLSDLWLLGVVGGKREYGRNVVKRYKLSVIR